jgi:hypothetical protein
VSALAVFTPSPLAGEGWVGGDSANLTGWLMHPHPFDSPPRKGEGRRFMLQRREPFEWMLS